MANPKLTPKQNRFVGEYLKDLNGTQAAIRAGYSPKTAQVIASQNLSKLMVQEVLTEAMQARVERTEISQDWVLRHLVANLEKAMQKRPVLDREDEPTGEYVYQGAVANKALELLGKHLGMFVDRAVVTHYDGMASLSKRVAERENGHGTNGIHANS